MFGHVVNTWAGALPPFHSAIQAPGWGMINGHPKWPVPWTDHVAAFWNISGRQRDLSIGVTAAWQWLVAGGLLLGPPSRGVCCVNKG